jgi:hypothetical protein
MNVFKSVAPGGIVISNQWDNWVSASYYLQYVKGIRTDIVVIDKDLCRKSWYLKQLQKNYPQLIEKSKKEVDEFLQEANKIEYELPYDDNQIREKYAAMLNSFVEKNIQNVPVYITSETGREIGAQYKRIPVGLVFRLSEKADYLPVDQIDWTFHPLNKKGKYPDMLMRFYGVMFVYRASYEHYFGYNDRAYQYLDKLQQILPDYEPAQVIRSEMESGTRDYNSN